MNKQEAEQFIERVFRHPFDGSQFARFAAEVLNDIDPKPFDYAGTLIKDAYKDHVRHYKRIGTYTDPNGDEVDVLIVHLKNGSALDRARTMQRNFIAHYLRDRSRQAALVAYYSESSDDWRVSLVRMEFKIEQDKQGRYIPVEDLTPARRFSFLVGENEPSHTAQSQFLPLLTEDKVNPTLEDLESAFNIETVTREFFDKYKGLFLQLKSGLDELVERDPIVHAEFIAKEIDTGRFAKKLLGQIVFLYFVQKKGWLGVTSGHEWGSGDKRFLRTLLENEERYTNYFNDILEPLFYNALATERKNNLFEQLDCQIPFLNGGLFEPLADYDWQGTDIIIDNHIFQRIFETFDLYNFTVRENEPLEKEVAVDPEMLGKVFENLLEVEDRKSKGAFYTPREIVQYMCQESLINYLDTTLNMQEVPVVDEAPVQADLFGNSPASQTTMTTWQRQEVVPRNDLAKLVREGEVARQHDAAKESGTKRGEYLVPESIRKRADEIDQALADIKICDPAIGSGAFPVGMMQEIIRAREVLTTYLGGESFERSPYALKRHAIQESIYGVDIDPGAVDIAKLRLWLSLVVDEDDYKTIKPLPNLDYKIVCGNSLASGKQIGLLNQIHYDELEALKPRFLKETAPEVKHKLRTRIDTIIEQVNESDGIDYRLYFSEVFRKNGGFDVVIGNPPYVRIQELKKFNPRQVEFLKASYKSASSGSYDLYVVFVERGLQLLNQRGHLSFILPHKFFKAKYGKPLRQLLANGEHLTKIVDFGHQQIFDGATTYVCLLFLSQRGAENVEVNEVRNVEGWYKNSTAIREELPSSSITSTEWNFVIGRAGEVFKKLDGLPSKLVDIANRMAQGIRTSANDVYVLNVISVIGKRKSQQMIMKKVST